MGRRGVDVEGPNNGGSIEEVREHLVDLGILLPVVAFGILLGIPEAERQNTIRFGVRRQDSLVHESRLFLQNRQVSSMAAQSSRAFSGLVVSSTTLVYMGGTPFLGRKLKGTSRRKRDVHINRVECDQRTPILLQGQLLKGRQGLSSRALFAEVMRPERPAA